MAYTPTTFTDLQNALKAYHGSGTGTNPNTWDVTAVTNMSELFNDTGLKTFNTSISSWNVSSVTNMSEMFRNTTAFNQDISGWDVSSVTDMDHMFAGTSSGPGAAITVFDQDLSA